MYRGHTCAHLKHINLILCVPCFIHTTYTRFRNNYLLHVVICLTLCWNVNNAYWIFIHIYLYTGFFLYFLLPSHFYAIVSSPNWIPSWASC